MVSKELIFVYYKQSFKTIVKTDFFDYVSSGVLSHLGKNRLLYYVIFFSKSLNLFKCNYEIYGKELLAIIQFFEQWRLELDTTRVSVKVITDHKNLEYFITIKKLSKRQIY